MSPGSVKLVQSKSRSDQSSQENGIGVFVPQIGPLHKEVVSQAVEDPSSQGQRLHSTDALHVDDVDFFHSQDSQQQSRSTQRNAGSWAVTQDLEKHREEGPITLPHWDMLVSSDWF